MCSHIRISADLCSFAAPRSFSQLVTSFFGSWCQGIHLMLFFAWTFCKVSFAVLSIFSWIAWVSEHFLFRFVNSCEKVLSFCLNLFSTFRWNCNLPKLERPIISTLWSRKKYLSSYLFVSYSSIYFYSVFNEHICDFDLTTQRVLSFDLRHSPTVDWPRQLAAGGLKWTRTTDLALIRRAL